jgi:hypothetical protein
MLGRPMCVRVGDCDVLPPGRVRLEEDEEDEVEEGGPTRWTFIALRHALGQITARVVEHFQDLAGGRHYDTVLGLDRELVAFWQALPAVYKIDGGARVERGRAMSTNGRGRNGKVQASRSSDRGTVAGSVHGDEAMEEVAKEPESGKTAHVQEEMEPGAYPMLATHRFMINTEIQYVRIALHRPYVLRAGEK